jgi:hypothetical protein
MWSMKAVLVSVLLAGACGATPQRGSMLRGDPEASAGARSAAARPRPYDDDAHPLNPDRFGVSEEMARRRSAHAAEHSRAGLSAQSYPHPACAGVASAERQRCPLLGPHWRARRESEGGVELEADGRLDPAALRMQLLCHIAQGSALGETRCPLHVAGVRVQSGERKGRTVLRIVTDRPREVDELRRRVREIIP